MKYSLRTTVTLPAVALASLAAALLAPDASAQTLVYQWDFDSGTGANTGTGTGGTLSTNGTATFTGTGVDGAANSAFSVTNSYTGGTGSGNSASSVSTLALNTMTQFTVTMWVNLRTGDLSNFPRLIEVGATTTPDTGSNPGINMALNNGNVQLGVNGNNITSPTGTVSSTLSSNTNDWVFMAYVYDGTSTTAFNSTAMSTAGYGSFNNTALVMGTDNTASSVAWNPGLAVQSGSFTVNPGSLALTGTASAYVANNAGGARGLTGTMDDIRIYNGILTTAQVEAVRLEAIPEPGTVVLSGLGLGCVMFAVRRRRMAA